jgi:hypothetical protein
MSSTPILLLLLSSVALVLMSLLYVHSQMQTNESTIAEMNAAISDLARQLAHQRDVAERTNRKARAAAAAADAAAAAVAAAGKSSASAEEASAKQLKLVRERDVAVESVRVREAQRNEAVASARRAENIARGVKLMMREHLERLNDWSNQAALLAKARVRDDDDDDDNGRRDDRDVFRGEIDPLLDGPIIDAGGPGIIRTQAPTPVTTTASGRRIVGSLVTRGPTPAPTPLPFFVVVAFSIEHDDGELATRQINGLLTELKSSQSLTPLLVFVRNERLDQKWSAQFRDKKDLMIVHEPKNRVPASALLTDTATPDEQTTTTHLEQLLNRAAQFGADFVLMTTDRATMCDRAWPSILNSIALVQKMAKNGWGSVRFAAGLDGLLVHRIALQQLIAFLIRYSKMASTEELVSQWIHGVWPGAMMHIDSAPRSPITAADFAKVNKTLPTTAQRHLLHFNELNAKFQSMMPVVPCMEPLVKHMNPLEIVPDKTALSASCKRETIRPCW